MSLGYEADWEGEKNAPLFFWKQGRGRASQLFLLTIETRHCQVLSFEPISDAPDLISQTVMLMRFAIHARSIPQEYLPFPEREIIDLQKCFPSFH